MGHSGRHASGRSMTHMLLASSSASSEMNAGIRLKLEKAECLSKNGKRRNNSADVQQLCAELQAGH